MSSAIILPPVTPSELVSQIMARHRYPTTILITSAKQPFFDALTYEIQSQDEEQRNHILHKTLLQTAVSRHIHLAFTPTVAHLRAYLSTFTQGDSRTPAPPNSKGADGASPLLLVYGFLEVHRVTTEWSAQGIANSAAALVEAAARNSFRAAVVEPRGGGVEFEALDEFLGEEVPLLSGTLRKESGAWSGRTVEIRSILGRWFEGQSA
ncbi:hypothetical protein ACRE_039970 [Hapsidospora chrysogenum ATCC 11550]|uniref:Uncharacterized protein n=1 Tax=Hapsidospora chrysogenum (strain ATCC 11550 / CBS 779.69 / DSM 880 / IAM 14645 / JCM 23072 / IMI 49137) TaxID=857340 RepID=A0A086T724_HAPC1|nr:hypothetical protein ACRE_039970 [Hapsidospora chrysogenum ATCC 11550]